MVVTTIPPLIKQLFAELATAGERAPHEPVAPELIVELTRRYGLPPAYQTLLAALGKHGFSISPGPFQQLVVYAAPQLEEAQVGYRSSHPGDDAFVEPRGWKRGWVVIATDAGDPYFLDIARATPEGECPVYAAEQGTGTWEPHLAASSIAQFLRILKIWLKIVVPHQDHQNPAEPLDDAHARRLRAEIAAIDPAAADHWSV